MSAPIQTLINFLNNSSTTSSPDLLGPNIPHVLLVLRVTKSKLIPKKIPRGIRKIYTTKTNGREFIKPGKIGCANIDAQPILEGLGMSGYKLIGACWEERKDLGGKLYYLIKFTFVLPNHEGVEENSTLKREVEKMIVSALWRVRAFINPFYEENQIIEGRRSISINLDGRKPLRHEEHKKGKDNFVVGEPVMVQLKDEYGELLEDKIPVSPARKLVIVNNKIQIVPV
ncbi:MAG: hypothetical protein CO137_03055 [Candidatus Magasanikbacteria bacterium CG_4_9_14_3_um_filter_32_9]|uniref:Uncharacterized protein n=1 Tax=Candidatus Magasanikbacteria bacterium CG_4_9_14_3_um_filter_32_9 TaxID=1974644 RepID=A0A2M7Z699_9BACT|nr:MAG: hypothetical protein CO137_03055 [Candidatus Magasanikbacteria bacterium CG_4_9_14_3_um_filter_32_9]